MSTSSGSLDLWLRSYQLTVTPSDGGAPISVISSDDEPNALRFTFDIKMYVQQPLWWADISIYNLDYATAKTIIAQGDTVLLQAGYQQGSHKKATIFQGKVFQPMWTREDVVDFKLTLQCFAGNAKGFVQTNYSRLQTQRQIVELMAKSAYNPIQVGQLDDVLDKTQESRAGVLFGDTETIIENIASDPAAYGGIGLTAWVDPTGLNIVDLGSLLNGGSLTPTHAAYAPPIPPGSNQKPVAGDDYSLIDTPQQTYEGVNFRVLLDPSLKIKYPPDVVSLDMSSTQINLLPLPGPLGNDSSGFIPPPSPSGSYIVAGLRHYGDTRGNPWYTEITGVTQNGLLLALGGKY